MSAALRAPFLDVTVAIVATPRDEQVRLTVEVEKARVAYYASQDWLRESMKEMFGALPRSDGMLRSKQAVKVYRKAFREYTDAMIRLNRYLLDSPAEDDGD